MTSSSFQKESDREGDFLVFRLKPNLILNAVLYLSTFLLLSLFFALKLVKPVADDYCFMSNAETQGAWQSYFHWILNWSPGYSSYTFSLLANWLNFPYFILSMLSLMALWLFMFLLMSFVFNGSIKPRLFNRRNIVIVNILTLMTVISTPSSDVFLLTVAWPINTVRVWELLVAFALIMSIIKNSFSRTNSLVITAISSIVLAGFTPQVSFSLLGLLILALAGQIITGKEILVTRNAIVTILLISILNLILMLSPGSRIRTEALDKSMRGGEPFELNQQAWTMFKYNLNRHISEAFYLPSIFIGIVTGFSIFYLSYRNFSPKDLSNLIIRMKSVLIVVTLFIPLLVAMNVFGSVVAYLQTWHYVNVNILVSVFGILFGGITALKFGSRLSHKNSGATLITILAMFFSCISISIIAIRVNSIQTSIEKRFSEINVRDAYNAGAGAVVDSGNKPLLALDGRQMTQDLSSDWILSCYRILIER